MPARLPDRADLVVVGAGIVGLAHAVEAVERGLAVAIVERRKQGIGASVRNFGHGFLSAQSGDALRFARAAKERWRNLADRAGFDFRETGTLLVVRTPEEIQVIREFAEANSELARLLTAEEVASIIPLGDGVLGALFTPLDYRIDPRSAVAAIARWLALRLEATLCFDTSFLAFESGRVRTTRGEIAANAVVIAVGHEVGELFPELAADAALRRCTLQMLRVASPHARTIEPTLATGLALLRYRGFASCPSVPALRARVEQERPELLEHEVNLLVTQLPGGDLIVGDTHAYSEVSTPFRDEELDLLILDEAARLLGVESLVVRERWLGVYPHSRANDFLVASPAPGMRVVAVTSGIGMTTALGLAPEVLDEMFEPAPAIVTGTAR